MIRHLLGVKTAEGRKTSGSECQQTVQTQLAELMTQMRGGQSATKQGQLEEQKKALRKQMTNC